MTIFMIQVKEHNARSIKGPSLKLVVNPAMSTTLKFKVGQIKLTARE